MGYKLICCMSFSFNYFTDSKICSGMSLLDISLLFSSIIFLISVCNAYSMMIPCCSVATLKQDFAAVPLNGE